MDNNRLIELFENIYKETYKSTLKYVIYKCKSIEDVNDIIQETYLEMYEALRKKKMIVNYQTYLKGIAKNKIKDHLSMKRKTNSISISQLNDDEEFITELDANVDIEIDFINRDNIDKIWEYVKCIDKNKNTPKIFYLHFIKSMTFKEISNELEIKESTVKSTLYRLQKKLKQFYLGGGKLGK